MRWRHLTGPPRSHRGGQGFKSSQLHFSKGEVFLLEPEHIDKTASLSVFRCGCCCGEVLCEVCRRPRRVEGHCSAGGCASRDPGCGR